MPFHNFQGKLESASTEHDLLHKKKDASAQIGILH